MGHADRATIAGGVPGRDLMEAAGRAAAAAAMAHWPGGPVVVLCGPGNNGGDGFVAARHLGKAGWPVRLGLLGTRDALRGDAAWAAGTWDGAVLPLSRELLDGRPRVIDALFGAGLTRPIDGVAGEVIDRLNDDGLPTLAIDVPSGLHGDTGEVLGRAPRAQHTVTFFRGKPGHFLLEGLRHCGALEIADIGISPATLGQIVPRQWLNAPLLWQHALRRSDIADHKFARGHATLLGGAAATGAARLAALAARRSGAGLVTIAAPASALGIYRAAEPGNLVVEADDGRAFARLVEDARRTAMLVGPGSGLDERTRVSALAALATGRNVVLDADAITVFADKPADLFDAVCGPVLLTPHEGEFRRLFPDLAAMPGKLARVRAAAARSGATILLKGPDTVVAAPDGRAVINVHASPALATAGAGDVLAGIAVGLMAQQLSPLAAAAAAAWMHGDCALRFGRPGLIAEDLVAQIPGAVQAALSAN